MKVGEKIPTSRQQRRARAQGFTETLQHARSGRGPRRLRPQRPPLAPPTDAVRRSARAARWATARAASCASGARSSARRSGRRRRHSRRWRCRSSPQRRRASRPHRSCGPSSGRCPSPSRRRECARVPRSRSRSVARCRSISAGVQGARGRSARRRRSGAPPPPSCPGSWSRCCPGISVARAEVRPQPNGDAVARCPALTPPWPSATKAPRYGTVAKW